jgi:hypothetical protein
MMFIMQAIQGSFEKHYLLALWNLKMKVLSTEKLTCLMCVSVAGEKVPLFVIGQYAKPGLSSIQIACLVIIGPLEKLGWFPSCLISSC